MKDPLLPPDYFMESSGHYFGWFVTQVENMSTSNPKYRLLTQTPNQKTTRSGKDVHRPRVTKSKTEYLLGNGTREVIIPEQKWKGSRGFLTLALYGYGRQEVLCITDEKTQRCTTGENLKDNDQCRVDVSIGLEWYKTYSTDGVVWWRLVSKVRRQTNET